MDSPPTPEPEVTFASDHSLLVTFGNEISEEMRLAVLRFTRKLLQEPRKDILNIHPAYSSVLITFDPRVTAPSELEQHFRRFLKRLESIDTPQPRLVEIPVCYEDEFAPDLEHVARHNNLTGPDVVRLHSSVAYTVYFLGFTPGFPYLGGMSKEISTPRHPTPRRLVAAGSVAIGGRQTGVYTVSSPGGWQIIGRTPLKLFDAGLQPPALLQMGDRVRFSPISRGDYAALSFHTVERH